MLLSQEAAGLEPGRVNGGPVDDGVRPGEVQVLEHADGLGPGAAVAGQGAHPLLLKDQDLPGHHVPDELGSHCVQRAAFRGHHIGPVLGDPVAQRPQAEGVPGGQELGGGHDHQGVGPLEGVHGPVHGPLDGGGGEPLPGDDVGDDLRVAGGVEDGAGHFQLGAQLVGVGQVAVVGQGHAALVVVDHDGLGVEPPVPSGGGVAHMAHGHGAGTQVVQDLRGKDLAHQPHVLVVPEQTVVADHNAAALLAPVL